MFQYSLSFLLLLAAISSSLSTSNKAAKLQLDRLDMNHISGLIHDGQPDACSLKFDVGADKKYIKSTITTKNLRTGEIIELTTLTLPKTIRRVIPGMRNAIVAAAANTSRMLTGHAGAVCANVAELYAQITPPFSAPRSVCNTTRLPSARRRQNMNWVSPCLCVRKI